MCDRSSLISAFKVSSGQSYYTKLGLAFDAAVTFLGNINSNLMHYILSITSFQKETSSFFSNFCSGFVLSLHLVHPSVIVYFNNFFSLAVVFLISDRYPLGLQSVWVPIQVAISLPE